MLPFRPGLKPITYDIILDSADLPAALRLASVSGGVKPVRTVVTSWSVSTQVRKRIRLQDPVTDRFGSAKIS